MGGQRNSVEIDIVRERLGRGGARNTGAVDVGKGGLWRKAAVEDYKWKGHVLQSWIVRDPEVV